MWSTIPSRILSPLCTHFQTDPKNKSGGFRKRYIWHAMLRGLWNWKRVLWLYWLCLHLQTTSYNWDWPGISCLLEGFLTTTSKMGDRGDEHYGAYDNHTKHAGVLAPSDTVSIICRSHLLLHFFFFFTVSARYGVQKYFKVLSLTHQSNEVRQSTQECSN